MDESTIEERLSTLETRVAFQDKIIDDLNLVVTEMRSLLDSQLGRWKEIASQLNETLVNKDGDQRPPHY